MRRPLRVRIIAHMTIDAAGWRVPEWTRGDRLRKARELTGLGQEAFGDETGISRRSISDYEGDKAVPRKPVMMAWAFRTGVPLEWLETGATPQGDPGPEGLPRLDSNQQPAG